ncbi:prepilin-type N-terminal cleavage/methylation domain-containing protein [Patescibacteria group bacterium]|nr:MAG: prepilin-type N-terminal cleavage/methylation domain-containing protein [Patescibacteria group bacterium]
MRSRWAFIQRSDGFTLLESLVGVAIVAIMATAVVSVFATNIVTMNLSQSRSTGLALANEKMEYLRDLPYDSLATQHGAIYPAGNILDTETVTRNNASYRVETSIRYVDDPFDGNLDGTINGKPQDLYPYDYKQAEIKVYTAKTNVKVATLTTNVAAKAAETSSSTGILRTKVQDANGQPVADATVHITNPSVSPAVDITTTTDSGGLVVIPKLPPDSSNRYNIVVTKSGYSTEQTYADPAGSQTATLVNPNILVQQIADVSFSIDRLATLSIQAVDTAGAPVPNLSITVTGNKTIYANPTVYKYSQAHLTDASGLASVGGLEWDSYSFAVPNGYYIVATIPYQSVVVPPQDTTSIKLVVTTDAAWPRITAISPVSDTTGSTVAVTISGANLASGSSVVLKRSGSTDINATNVVGSGASLTADLNLSGAATGDWDVVITKPDGKQVTQTGGFNVATP